MDIRLQLAVISSVSSSPWSNPRIRRIQTALKPLCSRRYSQPPSQRSGNNANDDEDDDDDDDKLSIDWDKAWSSFKKKGKKRFFSQFSLDRYVTWNPTRSNYPPSEEVDPIKRSEKLNLNIWTSPQFTIAVTILILVFLLVYTVLFPLK